MEQLGQKRPSITDRMLDVFDSPAYRDPLAYWAALVLGLIVANAMVGQGGGIFGLLVTAFFGWLLFVMLPAKARDAWRSRGN